VRDWQRGEGGGRGIFYHEPPRNFVGKTLTDTNGGRGDWQGLSRKFARFDIKF